MANNEEMLKYARKQCEPCAVAVLNQPNSGYMWAFQTSSEIDKRQHADICAWEIIKARHHIYTVWLDVKTVTDKHLDSGNYSIGMECVRFWRELRDNNMLDSYRVMFQVIRNGVRTDDFRIVRTDELLQFIDGLYPMGNPYVLLSMSRMWNELPYVELQSDILM